MAANETHLQMIQDAITRLAGQSTTIKGWAITVTGALLGYGITQSQVLLAVLAGYAILAFATLDAFYLALERAYRELFSRAVAGTAPDWEMTVAKPKLADTVGALLSPSSSLLYGASLIVVIAIGLTLAIR